MPGDPLLTFLGGLNVHPENLKLSVVNAIFRREEMVKLHEAFITSRLPLCLKREVLLTAQILARSNAEIPLAFAMWLLAVHESRPSDESIETMAGKILTGEIDANDFLLRED